MKGEANAVAECFRERSTSIPSFKIQFRKLRSPVAAPQLGLGCSLQLILPKCQLAGFILPTIFKHQRGAVFQNSTSLNLV
jgi:hypothetical protein